MLSPVDEPLRSWPPTDRPLVVGIAGGSCSGKTTISHALVEALGPEHVAYIQHDAYYRDLSHLPAEARHKMNFDHPDSLETELLIGQLGELRAGRSIDLPVWNFADHIRTSDTISVAPCPVIVLEGILILAEPELRDAFDLMIFVDTAADLRLMRRVERDILERGRTVGSVLAQYTATVRPMHDQFVEPSKRYADLVIQDGYNETAVAAVLSMLRTVLEGYVGLD